MTNNVNVVIPTDLRQKAWELRLNISEIARKALAAEVERIENETRLIDEVV